MKNYIKFSLLFLQAIVIICVVVILNFFIIYRVFIRLLGLCLCVRLFSKQIIFAYKTLYVIFICFFPSLGILFYLLNSVNNCKKLVIPKLKKNNKNLTNCSKTSNYIRTAFSGLEYPAESLRYYADGKKYFNALFWQIKNAKNFILLQYFIVKDGKLLTKLFSLLKDKSASGVKVYFLYDAFGSMKMEKQIIKFAFDNKINAKSFNPIGYIISSKINNRHHGKIAVIDGKIGFLGGVNVGDEYVNEHRRFGRWKDGGLSFSGGAVQGLINIFNDNYGNRVIKPQTAISETQKNNSAISVFSSKPTAGVSDIVEVYLTALYNAKKTITACTPYLVLDESVKNALISAVKRGVEVKIIVPEIPDKKTVYEVTLAYAGELEKQGVKIYTYKSGFIHSKNTVIDGKYTITGSGNLDYRSMYLHYESCALIKSVAFGKRVEKDILGNIKNYKDERSRIRRIIGGILKVFAPLM